MSRMEKKPFYRVEQDEFDPKAGCATCGHGRHWTVVSDDEVALSTSWDDKEIADEVCDLMNDAFEAGQERATNNAEEEKLVKFFRSKEGDALGRAGDYDNLSPAETAIRAMRATAK